jgi:hypothetical protein
MTSLQSDGTPFKIKAVMSFYNSGGSYLGNVGGSAYRCSGGMWTKVVITATAVTNAAYAIVQPQADTPMNAADVWYADEMGIFSGTAQFWS